VNGETVQPGRAGVRRGKPILTRIFTIEIHGVPIVAFEASSHAEARLLLKERWFIEDLRALKANGAAVWNGTARIDIRPATAEEAGRYQGVPQPSDGSLPLAYMGALSASHDASK
jgi:hypothetical protein